MFNYVMRSKIICNISKIIVIQIDIFPINEPDATVLKSTGSREATYNNLSKICDFILSHKLHFPCIHKYKISWFLTSIPVMYHKVKSKGQIL